MTDKLSKVRDVARQYRNANPQREGGVVLIWQGNAYGWKNCLHDASHEQPGAYAVDLDGHVFMAEGGDAYNGAKAWVAQLEPATSA
ncbi:antirestriction protein ArdR [Pseudomonas sp. GM_Psu_2]|uniref:antirestriction protein ArdR n=1 Tax=unclassified Pseudomonas TaxID=196821 RepID=UPI00226AB532|nr:antirestriction protein ArdR [Pseudomonas sp. GM_Psu_2]